MKRWSLVLTGMLLTGWPGWLCAAPVGYQPSGPAAELTADSLGLVAMEDSVRNAAAAVLFDHAAKDRDLESEFERKSGELLTLLAGPGPDRVKADELMERLSVIVDQLERSRVERVLRIGELIRPAQLKSIRARGGRRAAPLYGPAVPVMRATLTGREKKAIGLSDEESGYLSDFDRRERYFRNERMALKNELDRLLRVRKPDPAKVTDVLDRLAAVVRQGNITVLDRYYYADRVIFTPGRTAVINARRTKR